MDITPRSLLLTTVATTLALAALVLGTIFLPSAEPTGDGTTTVITDEDGAVTVLP